MATAKTTTRRATGDAVTDPGSLRLEEEERLAVLHGLPVLGENLHDAAGGLRFDLVHEFHRLDDAEDLTLFHDVAFADIGLGGGRGRPVEGADHRRLDRDGGRSRRVGHDAVIGAGGGRRDHRPSGGGRRRGRAALDACAYAARLNLDLRESQLDGHGREPARELDDTVLDARAGVRRAGGRGTLGHQPAAATRPRYSPVRVSTFTTSPSLRNSGTCTTAPVSSVAGLVPPCAVSPRTPGSVRATASSTKFGSSTVVGAPSM